MLHILFPAEGESWNAFARRAESAHGEVLLVLTGPDEALAAHPDDLKAFLKHCAGCAGRLRIATRQKTVVRAARGAGIRVVDRPSDFRRLLAGHPQRDEALRVYSPHLWQQYIRTHLQSMGLLSLPKLRVWMLIAVSGGLFFFVLFWLLPSAEIRVWAREDTVSQTANIFLVLSGATVDIPPRVRTMELVPLSVTVERTMTFDQITKDFSGESARGTMTVVNRSAEPYSLRAGTRVINQAGMIFRLQEPVNVDPGGEVDVRVKADDLDLYGEIIGERGNLPAGLRWNFPGLSREEQQLVYAENRSALTGGKTSFRTVLHERDLEVARKQLEQELLASAKQLVDEERELRNSRNRGVALDMLYYDELTRVAFHDFVLPREFLGRMVASVPVQGKLTYTAFAYDAQGILDLLRRELEAHVAEGKTLIPETVGLDRLVIHVIDYADDLSWIKLTVDLSGSEQYILDPLTPTGARFAKKVRRFLVGVKKEDALRILRNLPEVENAQISIWPPWNRTLPHIASHIAIVPMSRKAAQ